MTLYSYFALIIFALLLIFTFRIYFLFFGKAEFNPVKFIARVAIFGAISSVLYVVPFFNFQLPFVPPFLSIHFDEVPAFVCGFAYGPISGIAVLAIKTLVKLPFSSSLCVGELGDFLLSSIYVGVATFIYSKKRNLKGVGLGFLISSFIQIGCALLVNVYALIPFYLWMLKIEPMAMLGIMNKANPLIVDIKWSYGLLAVIPFNVIKDVLVVIITFIVYRSIHVFLRFTPKKKTRP